MGRAGQLPCKASLPVPLTATTLVHRNSLGAYRTHSAGWPGVQPTARPDMPLYGIPFHHSAPDPNPPPTLHGHLVQRQVAQRARHVGVLAVHGGGGAGLKLLARGLRAGAGG